MDQSRTGFDDMLRNRGLRPTRARRLILETLSADKSHPSAEDLFDAFRRKRKKVGAATLYQNLNRLADAGLVRRFPGPLGLMRFDGKLAPHDHVSCRECGRIDDVEDGGVRDPAQIEGLERAGWQVEGVRVEYDGLCPDCR